MVLATGGGGGNGGALFAFARIFGFIYLAVVVGLFVSYLLASLACLLVCVSCFTQKFRLNR